MTVSIPKPVLFALAALLLVAVGAGGALLVSGGDDEPETVTVTEAAQEVEPIPLPDGTETVPDDVAAETASDAPDCFGEFRDKFEEGTCWDSDVGKEVVVMNRDSTMKLKELSVGISGIDTADALTDVGVERPNGIFVIITLDVKNRLSQPVYFSDNQTQTSLVNRGKFYTEDFDASNGGDESSFTWQFEEIQPGTTQTGTVIFDVPKRVVTQLYSGNSSANLMISNFSDAERNNPKLPVGFFRLYEPPL